MVRTLDLRGSDVLMLAPRTAPLIHGLARIPGSTFIPTTCWRKLKVSSVSLIALLCLPAARGLRKLMAKSRVTGKTAMA